MGAKTSTTIDLMLELIDCYTCGVTFGMTSSLVQRYRDKTNESFYCPNGHAQHFTKSTAKLLEEEKAARTRAAESYESRLRIGRQNESDLSRSNAALRGQLTKLRKQIGAEA